MASQKSIHTIVLDTGAIIRNHPTVSSLIAQCEEIVTVPAIISEIRDAATRSRVEVQLQPFLTLRSPNPNSVKVVTDFARRTGDLAVLSGPDIQIVALAYEIECERNGGDWRLRKVPGQKGVNGAPPSRDVQMPVSETEVKQDEAASAGAPPEEKSIEAESSNVPKAEESVPVPEEVSQDQTASHAPTDGLTSTSEVQIENGMSDLGISETQAEASEETEPHAEDVTEAGSGDDDEEEASSSESDSGGWITPSNLKKHQTKDAGGSIEQGPEQKTMQVATLTTDFAMQNVILQMNLNLLSPAMQRVKHLKTFVLRCHACFQTTKQMDKQFCPKCGKPSLTRVACSTSANGEFKLHLKKNMQWNSRGDRYSIPKAVAGSSNGRVKGGGKGGWGNELILAEDQKEYMKALTTDKRTKERNLMDEDYLPSILTGDRGRAGGRIKVGAGRNVNSKKR